MNTMKQALSESVRIRTVLLADDKFLKNVASVAQAMVQCFASDGKVLLCGNGGSASDAQHIAAELSGRFRKDRKPLFAEALHVNSSYITAVANDYGYDAVFSRLCEAMGRKGDVLIALSTSGNSINVINAMKVARSQGMFVVAMLGEKDGSMAALADVSLHVPSSDTARIQEVHITIGHALCEMVEEQLFGN